MGQSIVSNASKNKPILHEYNANFYGFNFTISKKKKRRLEVKLSLTSLIYNCSYLLRNAKLDFYKSLEHGVFTYSMDSAASEFGGKYIGIGGFNALIIAKHKNGEYISGVLPHEIVHTYQHYDLFPISNFYQKRIDNYYDDSKYYKLFTKYLDLDYEALFHVMLYNSQPTPKYYKNYFEFEAEHFNRRKYIER